VEYDELPNNIPAEIKEIISDCLKKNPKFKINEFDDNPLIID